MDKNKVMEIKNQKVKREKNKAAKWFKYTTGMLEIRYGEVEINHPKAPDPVPGRKIMHTYRVAYDYTHVVTFNTSATIPTMKKRIRAMNNYDKYELVQIVDVDGRDTCIAV